MFSVVGISQPYLLRRHVLLLPDVVVLECDLRRFVDVKFRLFATHATPAAADTTENVPQNVAHLKQRRFSLDTYLNNGCALTRHYCTQNYTMFSMHCLRGTFQCLFMKCILRNQSVILWALLEKETKALK